LVSTAVLLIILDLRWPLRDVRGGWLLPLFFVFTLGTVWEAIQLLSRKIPLRVSTALGAALAASAFAMFPQWYSLWQKIGYPDACPVGQLGWVLIGCISAIGCTGVAAILELRRFAAGVAPAPVAMQPDATQSNESAITQQIERTTIAWMVSSFVIVYVVGCMSFWFLIRMQGTSLQGILHLISLLAIAKFADAGAYFVGKSFGKTKLIPILSPGKTVEGFIGGWLVSIVIAYVFLRIFVPAMGGQAGATWFGPALLGTLMTFVGLVGDLLESMVKRMVTAKDSGAMLPGLGGVWDVTDSLLPTAIVGYLGVISKIT
jgi:phosphatidate cytidylyltransferase